MKRNETVLSVTQVTRRIKELIETGIGLVLVEGELSNVRLHTSGHLYFTLKDSSSQISGVMWRSMVIHLAIDPADGMKVLVGGRITVYGVQGKYQIEAFNIRPLGVGELQLAYENLKQKLADEGLFDQDRKKALPKYPATLGVITSPTGAVLRDIVNIVRRRSPGVEVILLPVRVQGAGSAEDVAKAIAEFNNYGKVDALIIARGGGSLEDLWAFNEEKVARAIASSKLPIVSAVGHETDFTIADFVADLRAPTPSSAAELLVPERKAVVDTVRNYWYTLHDLMTQKVEGFRRQIRHLVGSYSFNKPLELLRTFAQRLDDIDRRISSATVHLLSLTNSRVQSLNHRLASVNPVAVLKRGYAIIRKDTIVVSTRQLLHEGDRVEIELHDGHVKSTIT